MDNLIIDKSYRGIIVYEPLENGYKDLRDGDEFVFLINNEIAPWRYRPGSNIGLDEIGKMIWDYSINEKDRLTLIHKFSRLKTHEIGL